MMQSLTIAKLLRSLIKCCSDLVLICSWSLSTNQSQSPPFEQNQPPIQSGIVSMVEIGCDWLRDDVYMYVLCLLMSYNT